MKLVATSLLAALLYAIVPAAIALPEGIAVRAAEPPSPTVCPDTLGSRELLKRDNAAVVEVDGLRYRVCPRTTSDCPAPGQYPIGTHITLHCYTRDNTTPINGDPGWAKIATNGYWVALAGGEYVSWTGELPYC